MDRHSEFIKAVQELETVESEYLEKFGDNSLDYVILFNPQGIHNYPEEMLLAADRLKEAIEENSPLDNSKPEVEVIY